MASGAAHRFVCLYLDRSWSGHVHGGPRHPRRTGRNGLTASASSVESQPVIFRASTFPDTDSPSAIMFKASIHITLRPSILDPQGKATHEALTQLDRKSTRLNSSHVAISYAVFCLKKKKR